MREGAATLHRCGVSDSTTKRACTGPVERCKSPPRRDRRIKIVRTTPPRHCTDAVSLILQQKTAPQRPGAIHNAINTKPMLPNHMHKTTGSPQNRKPQTANRKPKTPWSHTQRYQHQSDAPTCTKPPGRPKTANRKPQTTLEPYTTLSTPIRRAHMHKAIGPPQNRKPQTANQKPSPGRISSGAYGFTPAQLNY